MARLLGILINSYQKKCHTLVLFCSICDVQDIEELL